MLQEIIDAFSGMDLKFVILGLAVFVIQLLLAFSRKKAFVKLLPTILLVCATVVFYILLKGLTQNLGLAVLYLAILIYCGYAAVVCLLAWGIRFIAWIFQKIFRIG